MGNNRKSGTPRWGRFVLTVVIMLLITSGTLVGLYYYMQFILAQNERDGFTEEDLNAPLAVGWNVDVEEPPILKHPGQVPSVSCRLVWPVNGTSNLIDGFEGIGAVLNLTLINEGLTSIYVERVNYVTGWGTSDTMEVGYYVEPDTRRYIGHMMIEIPSPPPREEELNYKLDIDVLVEGPLSWIRKEGMDFETSAINLIPLSGIVDPPEYRVNQPYYYDKINDMVKSDNDELAAILQEEGLDNREFTIQDIVDAYQFVYDSLEYRPDPDDDENEWISPVTCLERQGGDCEDYSILLGSVITQMGGNARVIITSNHAFTSVYIGNDDSILENIDDRFGIDIPYQIMEDDLGLWLMIEPQAYLVFGWFPSDVQVQEGKQPGTYIYNNNVLGWAYEDSDVVYIVDIYI